VRVPLDWAMTQNNLGLALDGLGERESGTQHLTDAVTAYRAALEERTRARVPPEWAATQNNLGNALRDLGTRMNNLNDLCHALGDHVSAWQVFSGAAPCDASIAAGGAKADMDAIHTQFPGTAAACLQTYSADLKRMGLTNAEAASPPS
jgi:hypothetical protein